MSEEVKRSSPVGEAVNMGQSVKVVDEFGVRHDGIVTNQWGSKGAQICINVAYASKNPKKTDQYGQQLEHVSSCSHASAQPAPGRYWYVDSAFSRPTEHDGVKVYEENVAQAQAELEAKAAKAQEERVAAAAKEGSKEVGS